MNCQTIRYAASPKPKLAMVVVSWHFHLTDGPPGDLKGRGH